MKAFDEMNPARIGFLGVAVTLAVVLSAQNFDSVPILSAQPNYAGYFGDTGGLLTGDKVMVAGVDVGEVREIELEGDMVLVSFTAGGVTLGTETTLAIKTQTVLGSKFLDVAPRGDRLLASGDVIALDRTTSPYLLTDALGDLTNTISGLDTTEVTQALNTLGETLDATAPNLSATLDGVSRFSDSISTRDQMIEDLLGHAEGVTSVLAKRSGQIDQLVKDGSVLFGALDQRRQAIDTLLTRLSAVTAEVRGLIDENQAQLRPALDQLNQVTGLLDAHREDLQASLLPLQQYATSLGESVASGPFFKAYVMNLLPGQYLQPFIDAAFKDQGIDLNDLPGGVTYPVTCGENTPPGTVPPGGTEPAQDTCPNASPPPVQAPALPALPQLPALPALPALPPLPPLPALPGSGG